MIFDFPLASKHCHFAMAVDGQQIERLQQLTERDQARRFCASESRTYGLRWFDQPSIEVPPDLALPFALTEAQRSVLGTPSHPRLVSALRDRALERYPRLVALQAPEIIVANEAAAIRALLDDIVAFSASPVDAASSWALSPEPDLELLLDLCRVSGNIGLVDVFAHTNPVARALRGADIYVDSELHPARRLRVPVAEPHAYDLFIGQGDELLALAERLQTTPPQRPPSREEVEHSDDPSVLRLVDALPARVLDDALEALGRERGRYARTCRRLAEQGLALVSWIDRNPAV